MSTTVLDALENAKINFETAASLGHSGSPIRLIAMEQLSNAIAALDNGLGAHDVIQENILDEVNLR